MASSCTLDSGLGTPTLLLGNGVTRRYHLSCNPSPHDTHPVCLEYQSDQVDCKKCPSGFEVVAKKCVIQNIEEIN